MWLDNQFIKLQLTSIETIALPPSGDESLTKKTWKDS